MPLSIGVLTGLVIVAIARWLDYERERSFYPVLLVVIVSYYPLFAAQVSGPGSRDAAIEFALAGVFCTLVFSAGTRGLWCVSMALIAHGLFDLTRVHVAHAPGAPDWWPGFCGGVDLVLGLACARRAYAAGT